MSEENEETANNKNDSCEEENSRTVSLLSTGLLQLYEPHLAKVKQNLQELTAKQNKIFLDLSAQRSALVVSDINNVENMMERAKLYKEKLICIRRHMANIHNRTQSLKKRAFHIQACKEKDLASIVQKRLQEEALIGTANRGNS